MARVHGTNKEYIQALKTTSKMYNIEVMIDSSILEAVQVMIDIMTNPKAPMTVKMGAAKFVIEMHNKFAAEHGKNPVPADFVKDVTVTKADDGSGGALINMKFGG